MKIVRPSIVIIVAVCLLAVAPAQEQGGEKPWESWQPPEVQMPEPNAWDIYLRAFEMAERIDEGLKALRGEPVVGVGPEPAAPPAEAPEEAEEEAQAEAGRPGPPPMPPGAETPNAKRPLDFGWAQELETDRLARLVEAYSQVFRALEEAIAGEAQVSPVRSQEDIGVAFPHFADLRQAARMFHARSIYHLRQDRALPAALDGIACMHLAADVGTQGTLIAGLVQTACQAIGEAALREAIPDLDAAGAQIALNALQRAMAECASFGEIMEGEAIVGKALYVDIIIPALGEGRELAEIYQDEELAERATGVTPEDTWVALTEVFARRTEEAQKPYWARQQIQAPDNPIAQRSLATFKRSGLKFAFIEARLRCCVAALAAQAYQANRGAYPESLDQLVPEYLSEVPRDPFADAALRSAAGEPVSISRRHPASARGRVGAGVLTIYSVGADGDDDGGTDVGHDLEGDGDVALVLTQA
ncbi:MAG: hypothetical protein U9R79_06420 [Armatimonadota bacterium]|nr:hypothetical protein [Armatimonadota bacterium]